MSQRIERARRRRARSLAALGIASGLLGICAPTAMALADCTSLGGSAVCGGDVSHAEVGRRVIFPRGPAGERVGDFIVRPEGSLPQVQVRGPAATPGPRPLNRPDRLTDPRHGENFGAFDFPSGPSPLSRSPVR